MLKKYIYKILDLLILPIGLIVGYSILRLSFLKFYKHHLLSTWENKLNQSFIDKIFFRYVFRLWIKLDYLGEQDPNKREQLKGLAMGGESGKSWAQSYDSKSIDFSEKTGNLSFAEAHPFYKEIGNILHKSNDYLVIQIGSSSGKEIEYFASLFPQNYFLGTDIYKEVIDYASSTHVLSNLKFQIMPAHQIGNILINYTGKKILIFSSGSLQYVQPEHLDIFISEIAKYLNLEIILLEPQNEFYVSNHIINKSSYRGNFSFNHDYKFYAEKADIETINSRKIRPYIPYEDYPEHKGTVHYYYYGKSNNNRQL